MLFFVLFVCMCVCVCTCMLAWSITTVPVHMTLLSIMWKTPKAFINTSTALFKQHLITARGRMAGEMCDSAPDLHCGRAIDPPIAHTGFHSAPRSFQNKLLFVCADLRWQPSRGAKILDTSLPRSTFPSVMLSSSCDTDHFLDRRSKYYQLARKTHQSAVNLHFLSLFSKQFCHS